MGFVPDAIEPKGKFVPDEEKSVSGFIHNVGEDAYDTLKGIASIGKGLMTHPVDTAVNVVTGIPKGIINEGKRIGVGELLTGHPINALEKFGEAAYEKPLTTAMDVLPAVGAAKKMFGGAKAVETASEASQAAAKAGEAVKDVPLGSTFQETVSNLKNKIPDEVSTYLESKYGKATGTPGVVENFGRALEKKGLGMRIKEIGGTPGQVRQLRDRFGEKVVDDLANLAEEKGITKGFFNFQTGNAIENLKGQSGKTIGAIRDIASKRGAIHNPNELVSKIKAELDPVYLSGSGSSQKGAYMKALQDIEKSGSSASDLAKTITDKNALIKKNRMMQPIGAPTEVYNTASRLNNELISKFLTPEEAELYKESLRDFSASRVFDKMYGFTYGRDMAGRSVGGPWAPMNFIKDVGGRKIMEKVFTKIGRTMQKEPGKFRNPMALTHDVLDAVDESLDEIMQQMGKGEAP